MEPSALPLFILSALILLAVPGPAVFYIVARSVQQGTLAGLISTPGIAAGTLHVAEAVSGAHPDASPPV